MREIIIKNGAQSYQNKVYVSGAEKCQPYQVLKCVQAAENTVQNIIKTGEKSQGALHEYKNFV